MLINKLPVVLVVSTGLALLTSMLSAAEIGYSDTPFLPGQKWRVHDGSRPQRTIVTPGKTFSHMAPPPSDAVVLFNGTDLSKWKSDKGPARWKVQHGYMEVAKDAGSIRTVENFGDFQLHLEFATPAKVEGNSQGRGNSGVIIFGLYEVQVLDSVNNPTYADGQVGAMYGQYPPLVNAAKPPGIWQSYDIMFESAQWDNAGTLIKKANVTVILNGVLLHNRKEFIGTVKHREVATYAPHAPTGPIELQDHHNPTRYRNIWIRSVGQYD